MRASHFGGNALSDTNAGRRLSNRLTLFQDGSDHFRPTTGMSPVGQRVMLSARNEGPLAPPIQKSG
jgi:hypothetical protein